MITITEHYLAICIDWSMVSVFDRAIQTSCPVASTSVVRVAPPAEKSAVLSPEPSGMSSDYAIFDVTDGQCEEIHLRPLLMLTRSLLAAKPLDISMKWQEESKFMYREYGIL